jgi:DNA modification methylase
MPMHADIIVRARRIGFDNLTPILWHKITNANYEAGNGPGFLGKPYEPNAILKNDVEFILMLRKPGGYRQPMAEQREASRLSKQEHHEWFRQVWNGPSGESTRSHPAPFPEELAHRLVRMFSFAGDTVLDPFMGTGTTLLASARCGRNGIGIEVEPAYVRMAKERIERELAALFRPAMPVGRLSEEAARLSDPWISQREPIATPLAIGQQLCGQLPCATSESPQRRLQHPAAVSDRA